jgi:N-formylglutamate deformylase
MWDLTNGNSPLIAVALHHGHFLSPSFFNLSALDESARLREEDPHTGLWTKIAPTSVVVHRSRFELDLNRPRDRAVYHGPCYCNFWKFSACLEKGRASIRIPVGKQAHL